MDKQTLQDMIRRYSAELMQAAARSRLPREETPAQETPPPQAPAPAAAPLFLETIPEAEAPPDAAPLLEETEEGPVEINPPESGPGQDPLQPIRPENDTYAQFLEENPKTGWLRIQAYTGLGSGPAPGATAVISRQFADGVHVFATVQTDESGIADDIPLPAPDKSLAESPAGEAPYADYRITVTRPGYRTEVYTEVPVFDGIKSIQPVQLTPIKTNGAR